MYLLIGFFTYHLKAHTISSKLVSKVFAQKKQGKKNLTAQMCSNFGGFRDRSPLKPTISWYQKYLHRRKGVGGGGGGGGEFINQICSNFGGFRWEPNVKSATHKWIRTLTNTTRKFLLATVAVIVLNQ